MSGTDAIRGGLTSHFHAVLARIHQLVEPLTTEDLWAQPYAHGNSIGNLVLHLTGNLNYYVGAQIAQTGYIRHRDLEFSDSGRTKEALLGEFDAAVHLVVATLARQSDDDWSAAYSATGTQVPDRFSIMLECATHAGEHLGQIIYLQRELLARRR